MRSLTGLALILMFAAAPAFAEDAPPASAPAVAPKKSDKQVTVPRPVRPPLALRVASDDEILVATDTDETLPLPKYPPHALVATGKQEAYKLGEEDTLLDVARAYRLGFVEVRAANPDIDPWTPVPGQEIVIPGFKLLPRAPQEGIVVNLAEMRMYYFRTPGHAPITFPIGVGREGLQTPTGKTTIIRKTAGPMWFPTDRMREEKPYLPKAVPAGPSNPLGTHALYLGWPTFLIHGSNKPWAIGRRVSSGCMRMYPEDIRKLFELVPVGTRVTVVDQPILVGTVDGKLYLEVNPSKTQGNDIENDGDHTDKPLTDAVRKVIVEAAGVPDSAIDWDIVDAAFKARTGVPVVITAGEEKKSAPQKTEAPEVSPAPAASYNN